MNRILIFIFALTISACALAPPARAQDNVGTDADLAQEVDLRAVVGNIDAALNALAMLTRATNAASDVQARAEERVTLLKRLAENEKDPTKKRTLTYLAEQASKDAVAAGTIIGVANRAIHEATISLDDARAEIVPTEPPVDPPDPPIDPPAPGIVPPPDLSAAPFNAEIPYELWPRYRTYAEADCDWVIRDGVAFSNKGLGRVAFDDEGNVAGTCYRLSRNAGHAKPIVFGIWDDIGSAIVGGQWYHTSGRSVTWRDPATGQYEDPGAVFVGLDDVAEGSIGWSSAYVSPGGRPEWLQCMNLGLRGQGEWNFIMASNDGIDTLIVDGCYFLSAIKADGTLHKHVSGWHLDDWGTLVIKDQQNRGKLPTDPPALFHEHEYYFKSGEIVSWIIGNTFSGGNRTCFQFRPGSDDPGNKMPTHDIIIANNICNGYGWQYDDGTGSSVGGGAALTVWSAPPGDVFVFNNEVLDVRYSCLMIGAQGPHRDWYNDNGYIVTNAYIAGNHFSNPRATRSAVNLSAIENVYIWGDNELLEGGKWELLNEWAYGHHGIDNGTVRLLNGPMVGENFYKYDPVQDKTVRIDDAVLDAWRVDVPVVR